MGAADILTDVLLIIFPIPIVIYSSMSLKRKISLLLLFSLSALLIVITGIRVPFVIQQKGSQQYRTLWASCEILAAAAVSNSLVLGSFIRDKGIKRRKHQSGGTLNSTTTVNTLNSTDRLSYKRPSVTQKKIDSDDDLILSSGFRLDSDAEMKEMKMAVRSYRMHDTDSTLVVDRENDENEDGRYAASAVGLHISGHTGDHFDMRNGSGDGAESVKAYARVPDLCRKHSSLQPHSTDSYDLSNAVEMGRRRLHCSFPQHARVTFPSPESSGQRERSISFAADRFSPCNFSTKQNITSPAEARGLDARRSSRPELKQRDSGRGFMELDFAVVDEDQAKDIADARSHRRHHLSLSDVSSKNSIGRQLSVSPVASRGRLGEKVRGYGGQALLFSSSERQFSKSTETAEPCWSDWSFEQGSRRGRRTGDSDDDDGRGGNNGAEPVSLGKGWF